MKCRICGANLKNSGDLCSNCMNEEKETYENKKEILSIKRKHSLKYELIKYFYIYLIFILSGVMTQTVGGMITCLLLMVIVIGFLLFWNKRISKATSCKFDNKKIEFKCKFWIIDRQRTIFYKDLDSIRKEQSVLQRIFNLGNIYIYAKKGNLLTTGIEIVNVPNFKENLEKINAIVEEKK
ncbi:MAG: PH domain-containing protein [Candidatus Scatovivens sp.]